MSRPVWHCVRQEAGPLVKECRALRPRLSASDTPYERKLKNFILRPSRDSSVCRKRIDRLELRLALFDREGVVYGLTFDPEHEPRSLSDTRKAWQAFLRRLKKWKGESRSFDYVYLIEGRHGDHRYHLHAVLRYSDFSPAEVRYLWGCGMVDDAPLLRNERDSYRRTAEYFCKEATDGVTIPIGARVWVCSRSLVRKLQPPLKWMDVSGELTLPPAARRVGGGSWDNEFGAYRYLSYIREENSY